jgi:hypothetical protein
MERIFLYIVKLFYKIHLKNYLKKIRFLLNEKLKKNFIYIDVSAINNFNKKLSISEKKIILILDKPHQESVIKLKKNEFKVIKILEKEKNKLNKLKQVQNFIEHQNL